MSFTSAALESNEEKDIALDNANWYFYQNANSHCLAWPSLLTTTNNEKAKFDISCAKAFIKAVTSQC